MPLINQTNFDIIEVSKALSSPDAGLDTDISDDFKDTLDSAGASKEQIALIIAETLVRPTKLSGLQLKAAELAMEVHEIRHKNGKVNNIPVVNFIVKDSSVNINQIFNPQR